MLGSLIIGALAGALTRWAEVQVKPLIEKLEVKGTDLDDREILVLTFVLSMLAGAIILWLFGMSGTSFWLVLGAVLGFFWERVVEITKAIMDNKNGNDVAEVDEAEEAVAASKPKTTRKTSKK